LLFLADSSAAFSTTKTRTSRCGPTFVVCVCVWFMAYPKIKIHRRFKCSLRSVLSIIALVTSFGWLTIPHWHDPATNSLALGPRHSKVSATSLSTSMPRILPSLSNKTSITSPNFQSASTTGRFTNRYKQVTDTLFVANTTSTMFASRSIPGASSAAPPDSKCRKEGDGIVVVITRSVVAPPRRPARISAIAQTWGRDLTTSGVSVVVLSSQPEAECGQAFSKTGTLRNISVFCVKPPPSLDLAKDKALVFEWTVKGLLRNNGSWASFPVATGSGGGVRFFLWCNDHTFIVAPNFLWFIQHKLGNDHTRVAYAGKELKSGGRDFNSGAAGIILSRKSMETLVAMWEKPDDNPECLPPNKQPPTARARRKVEGNDSFGRVKEPGLLLADCLKLGGILPNRTRVLNSTEDYFHAYGPQRLVAGTYDEWYKNYHAPKQSGGRARELGSELDCCAAGTVSFHYVEAAECRAIYAVLSNQQKYRDMPDFERRKGWPKPKELSYSSPPKVDDMMWKFLTEKLIVHQPLPIKRPLASCF